MKNQNQTPNRDLRRRLRIIRQFQTAFPNAQLGGSLALLLYGCKITRDLSKSDLDFTLPELIDPNHEFFKDWTLISDLDRKKLSEKGLHDSGSDMLAGYFKEFDDDLIKIELNFARPSKIRKQRPKLINFKEHAYLLTPLHRILAFKAKYACNGITKHIEDLASICGISDSTEEDKPKTSKTEKQFDELPF